MPLNILIDCHLTLLNARVPLRPTLTLLIVHDLPLRAERVRGAKQGGGVGGSKPPLNFGGGGGLNSCQPPLILRKFLLGGVGSF